MSDFQRHRKSDKVKWIITFISVLLITVMLTGVCLQVFGTDNQKPSEWFNKTEQTKKNDKIPVIDENGNEMTGNIVYPMPSAMTFRTATNLATVANAVNGYDSVQLNATVKPDTAVDKSVDWSVAWKSNNNRNVNEYITVTPSSNGSTTATVQCLQPFDAQIIIVVTSRMNPNATATCSVDFSARPTAFTIKNLVVSGEFNTQNNLITIEPMVASFDKFSEYTQVSHAKLEVRTKTLHTTGDVTIKNFSIKGKPSTGLASALRAQGFVVYSDYTSLLTAISTPNENSKLISYFLMSGVGEVNGDNLIGDMNKLNHAIKNNTTSNYDYDIEIKVETNIGTYTYNVQFKVNRNASVFGVESIEIGDNIVI